MDTRNLIDSDSGRNPLNKPGQAVQLSWHNAGLLHALSELSEQIGDVLRAEGGRNRRHRNKSSTDIPAARQL
jgi:hypothetical protein